MGSDSDYDRMKGAGDVLSEFDISCEMKVISAHRSPAAAAAFAREAADGGCSVIIAGAGAAAHLAGTMAAWTTLPVIGVPLAGSPLGGVDALYATVQMPPGVPVATVGVDASRNAGYLAAAILALGDPALAARLVAHRAEMASQVARKAEVVAGRWEAERATGRARA
jgi:5-(carboxyamino)imidazole ribonucleotide mutase